MLTQRSGKRFIAIILNNCFGSKQTRIRVSEKQLLASPLLSQLLCCMYVRDSYYFAAHRIVRRRLSSRLATRPRRSIDPCRGAIGRQMPAGLSLNNMC